MNVFDLFAKINLDTGDYTNKLEGASGKFSAFGSAVMKGVGVVAKVTTAAVTAGSAATGKLIKEAITSYADYEQLVGGIETMFEDLSYDVQENASKAFKTAGLSQNEYMETVMGFSASLNQSLMAAEGNISRAADLADQTIIDMADNANKMGTSMESIQNAYQGFAKGNYTMLDNLKLGYGGTKEEMERLLEDATKLSGVKYDISSFADISEAIHVIQGDLGITGTTAKEASETISGSLSAMKSAWSNLLIGVSDDTQDFDSLVNDFVESAVTVGENILPRVQTALSGVGNLISGLAPVISDAITTIIPELLPSLLDSATTLVSTLSNTIVTLVPTIVPALLEAGYLIITSLGEAVTTNLPILVSVAEDLLSTLANGLVDNLPSIVDKIVSVVTSIVDYLSENVDQIVDVAALIVIALADGIIRNIPALLASAGRLLLAIVTKIMDGLNQMRDVAAKLISALAEGISSNINTIIQKAIDIVNGFKNAISSKIGEIVNVGMNIVQGIWQGISNGYTWITNKISGWVKDVLAFIKKAFGIASPSKLMRDEVGKYLAQGIWAGWEQENVFGNIQADINTKFNSVSSNKIASTGKSIESNSIDYQKLGNAVTDSLVRAGLTVKINNREIGRVVRTYA